MKIDNTLKTRSNALPLAVSIISTYSTFTFNNNKIVNSINRNHLPYKNNASNKSTSAQLKNFHINININNN